MRAKRTAFILLAALLIAPACASGGGGEGAGGIGLQDPIGAPDEGAPGTSLTTDSAVMKAASVEMDVEKPDISDAAQEVVDIATADIVGGFLVSSVVDTSEGFGSAQVTVKVPSPSFEKVVGDLNRVGNVTRQELEGKDLSDDSLAVLSRVKTGRALLEARLRRLNNSQDEDVRSELRASVGDLRARLAKLEESEAYIERVTSFSTIDVAIAGRQPAPPPEKPALERSLATAKTITERIGSGIILIAGVVVPLALLALVLYVLALPIIKRVKLRTAGSS